MARWRTGVVAIWLLAGTSAAAGQGTTATGADPAGRWVVPRLSAPVQMTGRVSDPVWDAIEPLPVVVQHPEYGMTPTERTEIRIAHDGEYLYASCRCFHSDPSGVRAASYFRDQWINDDTFSLFLDTFNDRETGVHLYTNPLGTKFDAQIYNDAELTPYGLPRLSEWDTFWDVAARIDDGGWTAEMRIPLSSLQFVEEDGRVVMGLIVYRLIWSRNERHIYPALEPRWARSYYKPSVAMEVVLEGVATRPAVHVTPYALGGVSERRSPVAGAPGELTSTRRWPAEFGLDARYSFRAPFSVDLTVNTDFAQVEADDQQVNLDRFSLFVPEKRRFFLERASLFDFPLGGLDRLFHSRRIGVGPDGEAQRIYGGGRVVGRVRGWDVGALNLQTEATGDGIGDNVSVLRLRRALLNRRSQAGAMLTSRIDADGRAEFAAGVDAVLNVFGDDFVSLRLAHVDGDADAAFSDRTHLDARWERRRQAGLSYRTVVTRSGSAFDPTLGFLARNAFTRFGDAVSYGWTPAAGPLQRHALTLRANTFLRQADGSLESAEFAPEWEFDFRNAAGISAAVRHRTEDVREAFRIAPQVVVPMGRHDFSDVVLSLRSRSGDAYRLAARAGAGGFFDGRRVWFEATPSWTVSSHFEVSGTYQQNRLDFPGDERRATTHLARLRARAALDVHSSGSAFVQYNSLNNVVLANLRVRRHFRDGTDLYLVYNHEFATRGGAPTEPRLRTMGNVLLLKYAHTISF